MSDPTSRQILYAFQKWYFKYDGQFIDKKVEPFLSADMEPLKGGWLRRVRQALFLSTGEMAKRLAMSRQAYAKFEINEQEGAITIRNLSSIVEVIDCELIYAIRPKQKMKFSEIIWNKILPQAMSHHWVKSRPEVLKGRALAAAAEWTMDDIKFRRCQKWIER